MKKRHTNSPLLTSLLLASIISAGCAGLNQNPISPKDKAEILYDSAMEDLEDGLFPEAIIGFSEIRTKHPYSPFAQLALLRIGDTNHNRAKYNDAIDDYKNFLKYYPSHELGKYALLQIGHSYYKQLPLDWWFLPPSAEKDQANIRRAINAYRETTLQHPDSDEAKLAGERIRECRSKLAKHEIYVARFYFKREKFKAATLRSNYLLEHYPNLGFEAEALLLAAQAFIQLEEPNQARRYLNRLLENHRSSPEATMGHQLLLNLPAPPSKS